MPKLSPTPDPTTAADSTSAMPTLQHLVARRDAALSMCGSNDPRTGDHIGRAAARRIHGLFSAASVQPVLSPFALHGLAGEIVEATDPITEATAPGMLFTLLTTFGAMVGR